MSSGITNASQYFSGWGAAVHMPNTSARQWIVPQSIQIIVAGILGLSSFLCEESPRHLCKAGRWDQARHALSRLWGLPTDHGEIKSALDGIHSQLETEHGVTGYEAWLSSLKELLLVKSNQKRLLFVASEQVLSQWSGASSITSMYSQDQLLTALLY